MIKKIIALILVLLMVVPMIASCGDDKKDDPKQTTSVGLNNDDDEEEEEDPLMKEIDEHIDELSSQYNFDGKSFTWIGGGAQAPDPESDGETGNVMSDALYFRQRDIEEAFKIEWINYSPESMEGDETHPVVDAVKQDVLAGSGAYDAGYGTPVAVANPLFLNDALTDVSEYNVIDFDNSWWPENLLDTYHINGAVYFLNGPIVTSNYEDTYCVIYNKQVADDYDIEPLYDVVKDGEWTFDKMFEVAEAIPQNANGSGAYRYAHPEGLATMFACGLTITHFDDNGVPYIDENLPTELSDLADTFSKIYGDDTQTVNTKGKLSGQYEDFAEKYDGYEGVSEMFDDDKILFDFVTTGDAAGMRELEVEFGILPMPKGSATQDDYISYVEPWTAFNVFVPKTTKEEKVTDVLLEAMAALGYKHIKPAYYDTILKGRSTYDEDSKEMIDIIFNTKVYDIIDFLVPDGGNSGDSDFVALLKGCITESSDGFTSRYFLNAMIVSRHMKGILADIESGR